MSATPVALFSLSTCFVGIIYWLDESTAKTIRRALL